eukprot:TRINITY_DN2268_c0_g2_i1.p2 TRINITY_DN2268_c0_g2~~TRINITY_DN2268_c0_g2_i1.p2  ORF type:complete len:120 (+),score=42.37 TRINITY_DN2268_c0_g2_i1:128-487(+)
MAHVDAKVHVGNPSSHTKGYEHVHLPKAAPSYRIENGVMHMKGAERMRPFLQLLDGRFHFDNVKLAQHRAKQQRQLQAAAAQRIAAAPQHTGGAQPTGHPAAASQPAAAAPAASAGQAH